MPPNQLHPASSHRGAFKPRATESILLLKTLQTLQRTKLQGTGPLRRWGDANKVSSLKLSKPTQDSHLGKWLSPQAAKAHDPQEVKETKTRLICSAPSVPGPGEGAAAPSNTRHPLHGGMCWGKPPTSPLHTDPPQELLLFLGTTQNAYVSG